MTRNEAKEMILSVIYDNSISESDKKEKVIEIFRDAEKGFGCRKARKLANQIQKESSFDMSAAILDKELNN